MNLSKGIFVAIPCPVCGYVMDIELLSVHLEERVFCPCCKVTIGLVDDGASLYAAQQEIESAIEDLRNTVSKLNQTVKIRI